MKTEMVTWDVGRDGVVVRAGFEYEGNGNGKMQ